MWKQSSNCNTNDSIRSGQQQKSESDATSFY